MITLSNHDLLILNISYTDLYSSSMHYNVIH